MQKSKNIHSFEGFTLIELLAAMVVLGAVGSLIAGIIFSVLRGAGKTNTLTSVRQNGNYAIAQMSKTLRNAQSFDGVSTNATDYLIACPNSPEPPNPPHKYTSIKITAADGTKNVVFSCQGNTIVAARPGLAGVSLFDNSLVTIANDADGNQLCYFTCQQINPSSPTTIGIFFSLKQAISTNFVDTSSTIPFQTSITFRNSPR